MSLLSSHRPYHTLYWAEILQKRVMRIICNTSYRSHTDVLFRNTRIFKIHVHVNDLYLFQLGQFMYNLNGNNIPASFKRMFKKNNTVHNYSTRQANDFHIPKARTNFVSRNFMFTGPKFWNSLDQLLKEACSLIVWRCYLQKNIKLWISKCNESTFDTINIIQNKIPIPNFLIFFIFSGYPHYSKLFLYFYFNNIQLQSSLYVILML